MATLGLVGCSSGDEDSAQASPGPVAFAGSASSLDALGASVWASIVTSDSAALERLRLSEAEHNETVWPEMPASEPGIGFPLDLAWLNIDSRNRAALDDVLSRYAGSSMEYVATQCDSATAYASFTLHSGCVVTLGDGRPRTERRSVELFRHALERDGGWKIVRYYDPHD